MLEVFATLAGMSWTPQTFAEQTVVHYAHAQSYNPRRSSDCDADLADALLAVASAQDAAREVIKALGQGPDRLDPMMFTYAEGYLANIESRTRVLREGFDFLRAP